MRLFPFLIISLLLSLSCSHQDAAERYDDVASEAGLLLTRETHLPGWQRADCFSCHLPKNLHLQNDSTLTGVDLEEVRRIVNEGGEASCSRCHGSNGL